MKTKYKVGFIVEGDRDKLIVETLSHRILPAEFDFHSVRIGGKAGLYTAYTTVLLFLDRDYQHTIIVFDKNESEDWLVPLVEETLERYGLVDEATICPAVPAIEAWLLAEYEENPEQVANPKLALAAHLQLPELTLEVIANLAKKLDIAKARQRSESFDHFVCALHQVEQAILVEDSVLAAV